MNGADVLIKGLQDRGVEFLAMLCGNGTEAIITSAHEAGLRMVDTRNEQAAGYMADAYARMTRRVGVCVVSSAIAHVNATAGMMNAWFDGSPFLLITGHSPSDQLGRGGFQDCDHVALAEPLCKYAELVTDTRRIPQALHEAVAAATSGRPGPVHLTIPKDVLEGEFDTAAPMPELGARGEAVNIAAADEQAVAEAAALVARSERPLIVAGTGVFYADGGEELLAFAHRTGAPIVTPIWDRGVINEPDELFMGVIGAASGEPELQMRADLMIIAGAGVDYRLRFLDRPPLREDLKIVRIDVDPGQLHRRVEPDVALLGDPKSVFAQLVEAYDGSGHDEWLAEAKRLHAEFYATWDTRPETGTGAIVGWDVVRALRECLTEETILAVDGGNIGQWAHMTLLRNSYPEALLTCGASGVVGYGVPGAMAAKLAFPDRRVLLLTGDGSLGFCLPEFQSAARHDLPFVAVLANDQAWGIVVSGQRRSGRPRAASELGHLDWVRTVEGLGGRGVRVESPEQIAPAVEEGFASGRPTLVEVPIVVLG
ncbi:MAG: thiamine pyrophosphate-binding protein, partial [Armatimonadetes bacterium]|nr:thiamine pyrophosphate-binding protein [Armatimonadota bacterium]